MCVVESLGDGRSVVCRRSGFGRRRCRVDNRGHNLAGFLVVVDLDEVSDLERGGQNQFGKFVLEVLLDSTFQGACAKLRVVAAVGNEIACGLGEFESVAHVGKAASETFEFDVDNLENRRTVEGFKHDDVVDAVDELRLEVDAGYPLDCKCSLLRNLFCSAGGYFPGIGYL